MEVQCCACDFLPKAHLPESPTMMTCGRSCLRCINYRNMTPHQRKAQLSAKPRWAIIGCVASSWYLSLFISVIHYRRHATEFEYEPYPRGAGIVGALYQALLINTYAYKYYYSSLTDHVRIFFFA